MPTAALGVMVYGLPETWAVAAAPALTRVTLPMVLPFNRPESVNSVPVKVKVCP